MNDIRALIFDCDGTLVDTMPLHWRAWQIITQRHGLHFPEDRFYAYGGVPTRDILKLAVGLIATLAAMVLGLLVSAASGAVGSVVGQLAKMSGCRAVGIAGGPEKCAYVRDELGFDACIDHREHKEIRSMSLALKEAAPVQKHAAPKPRKAAAKRKGG